MVIAALLRYRILCVAAGMFLLPAAAFPVELHVYLANADHISGEQLALDESSLSILTSYSGRMVIARSAIKGISSDAERAREILEFTGEKDIVHNRNGDRISGQVVELKDSTVFVKAFFAADKVVQVGLEQQLDYLVFASGNKAQPASEPDVVRVIFTNGDVASGKVVGFDEGRFVLVPPYCEQIRFDATAFRSLHNAKQSREFYEGGLAEALMDIIEKSGESRGIYGQVYSSLIKSFLKDGDKKGAILIFRRISSTVSDQYVFQTVGDQFLANNMLEAAVEAYENMVEKSPTYYYSYTKLFEAYMKMGRYSEAAETYERLLSDPGINLSVYGIAAAKIRMDLSDAYIKIEKLDKAAQQLRLVIASPGEQEDLRRQALSKLVGLFKQEGKIEALIQRYNAELRENSRVIGESYIEMVKICLNEGKITKAKSYVQRLTDIGLTEYAEEARRLTEASPAVE